MSTVVVDSEPTLRMVLMMNRSSCDRKKTLPDLPGDGSSRRAWSPVGTGEPLLYLSMSYCLLVACVQLETAAIHAKAFMPSMRVAHVLMCSEHVRTTE